MGSSRPSFHYNSVTNRWEVRRKGGDVIASFHDDGRVIATKGFHVSGAAAAATLGIMNVASLSTLNTVAIGGGDTLSRVMHVVGSPATIASVPTNPAIGSIPATGIRLNDIIFANSRVTIPAGLMVGNFFASGSNNVNFHVSNFNDGVTGSLVGCGWDVLAIRKS